MNNQNEAPVDNDTTTLNIPSPTVSDIKKLRLAVAWGLGLSLLLLSLTAGLSAAYQLLPSVFIALLTTIIAFISGIFVVLIIHEWGHYRGVKLAASNINIVSGYGFPVFAFNIEKNTRRQFLSMAFGGNIGHWIGFFLLIWFIGFESYGFSVLLSGGFGFVTYATIDEGPVLWQVVIKKIAPIDAVSWQQKFIRTKIIGAIFTGYLFYLATFS